MVPTPTNDKIIVTKIDEERTSAAGLFVAGDSYDEPAKGIVEAIGSGITLEGSKRDTGLQVGDTVVFPKYGGTEITVENKDYIVLNFSDVLAKITSDVS